MVAPFLLVVKDEDEKVFSVEGPMQDDRAWMERIVAAQDAGRAVRCFTAASLDRQEVARGMTEQFGYDEVASVPLLRRSN